MAGEIVRLEKLVKSREDYMCSLENEAIMIRKEIKESKFNNEKQGYNGFVGGLTQLRSNRVRSSSNNRGVDRISAERKLVNLSNHNYTMPEKQAKGYDDDLPQKDLNYGSRYEVDTRRNYQVPSPLNTSSHRDARERLMMSELN